MTSIKRAFRKRLGSKAELNVDELILTDPELLTVAHTGWLSKKTTFVGGSDINMCIICTVQYGMRIVPTCMYYYNIYYKCTMY